MWPLAINILCRVFFEKLALENFTSTSKPHALPFSNQCVLIGIFKVERRRKYEVFWFHVCLLIPYFRRSKENLIIKKAIISGERSTSSISPFKFIEPFVSFTRGKSNFNTGYKKQIQHAARFIDSFMKKLCDQTCCTIYGKYSLSVSASTIRTT